MFRRRAKVTSVVTGGHYPCKRSRWTVAVAVLCGLYLLALLVALFVTKGFHVGVGALGLSAIGSAVGIAAQAGIATGTPARPHPPPTASYSEHWAWHRLQPLKQPWVWPVVFGLLVAGGILGAMWLGGR